jgi:hypothetical protein
VQLSGKLENKRFTDAGADEMIIFVVVAGLLRIIFLLINFFFLRVNFFRLESVRDNKKFSLRDTILESQKKLKIA